MKCIICQQCGNWNIWEAVNGMWIKWQGNPFASVGVAERAISSEANSRKITRYEWKVDKTGTAISTPPTD